MASPTTSIRKSAVVRDASYKSPLALALEERAANRPVPSFDISGFMGLGGKELPRIGIRIPTANEQQRALDGAHRYVADHAKSAGDGADGVRNDREILANAKATFIAAEFCREVELDPENPGEYIHANWPAFPGPVWMCDHLQPEQIAVLVNLANEVRAKNSGTPGLDDDTVEAFVSVCASQEEPEYLMIACSREYVVQLEILTAHKLVAARNENDRLIQENAELRARLGDREDLAVAVDGYRCAGIRYPGDGPARWIIGCKDLDGSMHYGPREGVFLALLTGPPAEAELRCFAAQVIAGTVDAAALDALQGAPMGADDAEPVTP